MRESGVAGIAGTARTTWQSSGDAVPFRGAEVVSGATLAMVTARLGFESVACAPDLSIADQALVAADVAGTAWVARCAAVQAPTAGTDQEIGRARVSGTACLVRVAAAHALVIRADLMIGTGAAIHCAATAIRGSTAAGVGWHSAGRVAGSGVPPAPGWFCCPLFFPSFRCLPLFFCFFRSLFSAW
jgi:hypothetical protein